MTPIFFCMCAQVTGKILWQRQNRKAQRWQWFQWNDESKVLNHIAVERTVTHSKFTHTHTHTYLRYMYFSLTEKLRLTLKKEVRDGYVELGVSS